jgi:hypothetical protein
MNDATLARDEWQVRRPGGAPLSGVKSALEVPPGGTSKINSLLVPPGQQR